MSDHDLPLFFKGEEGGFPWVQIMENKFKECLGDRKGRDGHLAKKFLKKKIPSPSYRGYHVDNLNVVTRPNQFLALGV